MSELRKLIWDAVEARIDGAYPDGIAADGEFNEHVYDQQRSYINGMRAARLACINALSQPKRLSSPASAESVDNPLTSRQGRMMDENSTREECARLVDDMVAGEKPGRAKMMLAIAAKTVHRGRPLTPAEQLENLRRAMRDWQIEVMDQHIPS